MKRVCKWQIRRRWIPLVTWEGQPTDGGHFDAAKKRLDIFLYRYMFYGMARAATTSDAFNAVAEPRRRDILNYLALQERSVSEIVDSLEMGQPSASKHLKVLRDVGLVRARRDGKRILYRTNADGIRPLHEWTSMFEKFWSQQLLRVKERAELKIGTTSPATNHQANHSNNGLKRPKEKA